ncbi:MAG: 30S ribosomal protein S12 methylthiotransferase RimO [Phycisphaerales bacterium]|nr:30S ribosomal protein S12 methylthiotransferase RimO [Phycisphaerales bacterium]MCB9856570.1 30S ribosomal protein S12 methylthiotransferase RimO [Phycisphaerales bacterium]MCB9864633.1 30S ribosomal protein S12 methylthiotransferase RimO [Phycisphaerales bacterium]
MQMPSVSFVSLGCPKNLVDSEKMLGLLAEAGCPIVSDDSGVGEVVIVNTCGFLSASREEAVDVLREIAVHKRNGDVKRIVAAGCLVQRDGQGLLKDVPEIDALVGVNNRRDIVRAVRAAAEAAASDAPPSEGSRLFLGSYHDASWTDANKSDRARLRLTPAHYAYLRMSEGCNQKCTFCTIPSIRGPMHCKGVDEIMAEARELIDDGAVEINLIGQDTTSYGQDIGYDAGLSGLLKTLNTLDGVHWIRLMYAYPSDFTDEMIDAIADNERIAKYIDIPLQHISDRVLKSMHRRVTRKETEVLLEKLRDRIPGVSIRTTFISGFPGETDADHDELHEFIRDFGFDMLGVFPYSNEPGTPAHNMKTHLPPELIEERVEELMLAQQEVAFERAELRIGTKFDVLIDDYGDEGTYPARHEGQAPDVDSIVYVEGGEFDPGDIVKVRCTGTDEYDLVARPADGKLPVIQ